MILDVKNLCVSYASGNEVVEAVKNLSFSIQQGETIGIVGESGSGKSTTALAIANLLNENAKVEADSILFKSSDDEFTDLAIKNHSTFNMRGKEIGVVFQNPSSSLNPVLTCGYQISEPLLKHLHLSKDEAYRKCLSLLNEAGLIETERIFKAYPGDLSGGQVQRVMIAMAMSCEPSLLIADEPTTSLDATVQAKILDLFKTLKSKHNMSMIYISHDIALLSQIADKILVIRKGVVIEQGSTKSIFTEPQQAYTKALIACRTPINKRFNFLPTINTYEENALKPIVVSKEERLERHRKLYQSDKILEVKDLYLSYSKRKSFLSLKPERTEVLKNIHFDLFQGEVLGLVGESGSGKTSIGKALMSLTPVDRGTAFLKEKNLLEPSNDKRFKREIQMVFQEPFSSFNPRMTIAESLLEPMKLHKVFNSDKERFHYIVTVLNKVKLELSSLRKYPNEFSGGQIQRLAIARALILSPSCIIFDECVSALDVSVQAHVLNLINEIKTDLNLSCVFISHDLSVVRYMCDRIMVLEKGEIVETGEADELFNTPKHPYTQMLLNSIIQPSF